MPGKIKKAPVFRPLFTIISLACLTFYVLLPAFAYPLVTTWSRRACNKNGKPTPRKRHDISSGLIIRN